MLTPGKRWWQIWKGSPKRYQLMPLLTRKIYLLRWTKYGIWWSLYIRFVGVWLLGSRNLTRCKPHSLNFEWINGWSFISWMAANLCCNFQGYLLDFCFTKDFRHFQHFLLLTFNFGRILTWLKVMIYIL